MKRNVSGDISFKKDSERKRTHYEMYKLNCFVVCLFVGSHRVWIDSKECFESGGGKYRPQV